MVEATIAKGAEAAGRGRLRCSGTLSRVSGLHWTGIGRWSAPRHQPTARFSSPEKAATPAGSERTPAPTMFLIRFPTDCGSDEPCTAAEPPPRASVAPTDPPSAPEIAAASCFWVGKTRLSDGRGFPGADSSPLLPPTSRETRMRETRRIFQGVKPTKIFKLNMRTAVLIFTNYKNVQSTSFVVRTTAWWCFRPTASENLST